LQAGLGEGDLPVLVGHAVAVPGLVVTLGEGEREVGHVRPVVQEELLDLPALVAEAEDEAPVPVVAVQLHDVPEDRPSTDVHHGLRQPLAHLADAGALSAAKDDNRGVVIHQEACPSAVWEVLLVEVAAQLGSAPLISRKTRLLAIASSCGVVTWTLPTSPE